MGKALNEKLEIEARLEMFEREKEKLRMKNYQEDQEAKVSELEHKRHYNQDAMKSLMIGADLDSESAKKVVIAAANGLLKHIFIKY